MCITYSPTHAATPAVARQAAPRWCSTRTPVTAWHHHTTQPRPVATGWAQRPSPSKIRTERLPPRKFLRSHGCGPSRVGRVLSDGQVNEFAERGFVLVPQVVQGDVLARAARRIDEVVAADPPAADKRGSHFYFLPTKDEPTLMAPLTGTPAFGLAEELPGARTLEVPWQVQIALNIPPYSHRPGRPHIDAANPEPTREPISGTFTL